jgi:hypothetical protein
LIGKPRDDLMLRLAAAASFCLFAFAGATPLQAQSLPAPGATITLKIGQSVPLYGMRTKDCAAESPAYDRAITAMPAAKFVSYSDGGTGKRKSKACADKDIGIRIIKITGSSAGSETLTVGTDKFNIVVK